MPMLPTEILFEICTNADRDTRRQLRLVSKRVYEVVTDKDLSIHYRYDRSIAQMRGIIESPLPFCVNFLYRLSRFSRVMKGVCILFFLEIISTKYK